MRRSLAFALTIAVVALVSGCGDEALSKGEFVAKADAICTKYDKQLQALPKPKTIDDIGSLADKAIPIFESGVGELKDLKPPDALRNDVQRWIALNERELDDFKALRDAAREGDASKTQVLATKISKQEQQADSLARQIGLKRCGTSSSPA